MKTSVRLLRARLDKIPQAFREGVLVEEIGRRFAMAPDRVRRALKAFGIDPRRQLEAVAAENSRLRLRLTELERRNAA